MSGGPDLPKCDMAVDDERKIWSLGIGFPRGEVETAFETGERI